MKSVAFNGDNGFIIKSHFEEQEEKQLSHIYHKIDNLNMWVGDSNAFDSLVGYEADSSFDLIVQAAKEPYHRKAVGYTGQGATPGPEYLCTRRNNRLILNLIDPVRGHFIRQDMIDSVVAEVVLRLKNNESVFIHCNKGESRAPSIAFLVWLVLQDSPLKGNKADMDTLMDCFRKHYSEFNPSEGFREFIYFYGPDYIRFMKRWDKLCLI